MKKTLSVFLSFVMLLSCLCFGSITAQAAKVKADNLTSLYDADTQTLYIKGKGKIPAYYMGFSGREYDSYVAEKDYISDASITIRNPNGDIAVTVQELTMQKSNRRRYYNTFQAIINQRTIPYRLQCAGQHNLF